MLEYFLKVITQSFFEDTFCLFVCGTDQQRVFHFLRNGKNTLLYPLLFFTRPMPVHLFWTANLVGFFGIVGRGGE